MLPRYTSLSNIILLFIFFTAASFLFISVSARTLSQAKYREDYNGDGAANISDVIALLLYQRANPGDIEGDYNGDGSASVTDAIAMLLAINSGNLTPVSEEPDDANLEPGVYKSVRGIQLSFIPTGTFGTEPGIVSIDSFWIGCTEITQQQYLSVMGINKANQYGDSLPADQINWYDAATFCNELSIASGLDTCYNLNSWECDFTKNGFRLPTDAEWEYACRAGTNTFYYTGDSESDLDRAGWYYSNSNLITHPVGLKEPNAWGLYDMHGNIAEWCNDWYSSSYGRLEPEDNPRGPDTGTEKVLRGGSISWRSSNCTVSYRSFGHISSDNYGFRIARNGGTFPNVPLRRIFGRILADGEPLENVKITVRGTGVYWTQVSDFSGYFECDSLVDGKYSVLFEAEGYMFSGPNLEMSIDGADSPELEITAEEIIPGEVAEFQDISMIQIPSGSFVMGVEDTSEAWKDARPAHSVYVDSFMISQTEITLQQYNYVSNSSQNIDYSTSGNYPVYNLSWHSAAAYCNKLSELIGLEPCYDPATWECDFNKSGFRLPTEAEWEYACRSTSTTNYHEGNSAEDLNKVGWYAENSGGSPHLVALKEPNAWGLYDMHGNVAEWCNDGYSESYYGESPLDNPPGIPLNSHWMVVRGGGAGDEAVNCYSANRGWYQPDKIYNNGIGFRIVTRTRDFNLDHVITSTEGGEVNIAGKVSLEIPSGVYSEDVSLRVEEVTDASIPVPNLWEKDEFQRMEILGSPFRFGYWNLENNNPEIVPETDDSVRIAVKLPASEINPEYLTLAFIDSDLNIRFLWSDVDESGSTISAHLPAELLVDEPAETENGQVQLQSSLVSKLVYIGYVVALNFSNQICGAESLGEFNSEWMQPDPEKIPVIFIHGWQPPYQSCLAYSSVEPFSVMKPALREFQEWKVAENFEFYTFSYPTFQFIGDNAELLKKKINEEMVYRDDIVLICHSMGGLVARYYVEKLGGNDKVQRVITCGTPHRGSTLAYEATVYLPTPGSRSLKPEVLNGIFGGGVSKKYITYAGDISSSPWESLIDPFLKITQAIQLSSGDGIVAIESAIPGGARRDSIFVGYDHLEMQDGNREIENHTDDPLFQSVHRDLRDVFSTLPENLIMVTIPGGSYLMGDTSLGFSDYARDEEKPIHSVSISEFQMSATEITQSQWKSVMGLPMPRVLESGVNYPVGISDIEDIKKFCDRLSVLCGLEPCYENGIYDESGENLLYSCDFSKNGFRLPTEAEWEYACRAGSKTLFCNGNEEADLGNVAWCSGTSNNKVKPVAMKEPNAWGLYDMHGNVKELCNDYYDPEYYSISPSDNPTGPPYNGEKTTSSSANPSPSEYQYIVVRGGYYLLGPIFCRSASRSYTDPQDVDHAVGFRVVCRGQYPPPDDDE